MIVVFYGQPGSGKTTLAKLLQERIFLLNQPTPVILDGDEIREIFKEFHIIETSVRWSLGKEYNEANEVIILNFEPPKIA